MADQISQTPPASQQSPLEGAPFLETLSRYWREIAIGLVIVVGGILLHGYNARVQAQKEDAAWRSTFLEIYKVQEGKGGELAQALKTAITTSPGTQAEAYAVARLVPLLGQKAIREIDPEKKTSILEDALTQAKRFLQVRGDHAFAPQIRTAYGKILMLKKDYAGAMKQFEDVLASEATYLVPEVRLAKAQCMERMGQIAQAEMAYRAIASEGLSNGWPQELLLVADFSQTLLLQEAGMSEAPVAPEVPAPDPATPDTTSPTTPAEAAPAGPAGPEAPTVPTAPETSTIIPPAASTTDTPEPAATADTPTAPARRGFFRDR